MLVLGLLFIMYKVFRVFFCFVWFIGRGNFKGFMFGFFFEWEFIFGLEYIIFVILWSDLVVRWYIIGFGFLYEVYRSGCFMSFM